jgi:hypothetical protein
MLQHGEDAEQGEEQVCFEAPQVVVGEHDDEPGAGAKRNPRVEPLPEDPAECQSSDR